MEICRGGFLICPCGVYDVFVRAVTVFLLCRCSLTSTLQKPCTCFALSSVSGTLRAIAAKTPPALFHRSYRCYIYVTPLGSGEKLPQCVWRSRIADRNNAPRSVSRVRSGFRDDYEGGIVVCDKKLPQCCLPLLPKVLKNLMGVKLGQKRAVFYDNTNNM